MPELKSAFDKQAHHQYLRNSSLFSLLLYLFVLPFDLLIMSWFGPGVGHTLLAAFFADRFLSGCAELFFLRGFFRRVWFQVMEEKELCSSSYRNFLAEYFQWYKAQVVCKFKACKKRCGLGSGIAFFVFNILLIGLACREQTWNPWGTDLWGITGSAYSCLRPLLGLFGLGGLLSLLSSILLPHKASCRSQSCCARPSGFQPDMESESCSLESGIPARSCFSFVLDLLLYFAIIGLVDLLIFSCAREESVVLIGIEVLFILVGRLYLFYRSRERLWYRPMERFLRLAWNVRKSEAGTLPSQI